MHIVSDILHQMTQAGLVKKPQAKFITHLLCVWLAVRGRFNFVNLSRYSTYDERTLRRHFSCDFAWGTFNRHLVEALLPTASQGREVILAMDASFVPKSGKHTTGLAYFFNGCVGRSEKGLELSLVSAMDVIANTAYTLHAQQTLPSKTNQTNKTNKTQEEETETRLTLYLQHLEATRAYWPQGVRHVVVDGYYTRRPFVEGARALGLEVVGKLRRDANLCFLYSGPQQSRGRPRLMTRRPRLYDAKVRWDDLDWSRWTCEGELEAGVRLYSAQLYHVALRRVIKVAMLHKDKDKDKGAKSGKAQHVLLFSTDLSLSGAQIVRYYRARYQIEFLFRDGKQGLGLNDCQARDSKALEFHWNPALCALNLAKRQEAQRSGVLTRAPEAAPEAPEAAPEAKAARFSLALCKQRCSNQQLLEVFSNKLGLEWSWVKSQPCYFDLCNYGTIRP